MYVQESTGPSIATATPAPLASGSCSCPLNNSLALMARARHSLFTISIPMHFGIVLRSNDSNVLLVFIPTFYLIQEIR